MPLPLWRALLGLGLLCAAGAQTSEEFAETMLRRYADRARLRARAGRLPLAVHVGPSLLSEADLNFYQSMRSAGPFRAVLVEPNPRLAARLEERILSGGIDPQHVTVLNKAVCRTSGQHVSFYRYSASLLEDFPDAASMLDKMDEWGTLEGPQFLLHDVGVKTEHYWRRLPGAIQPRWESYVEEVPVPCVTPPQLLAAAAAQPQDVDFMIVDAEGLDIEIVHTLLGNPRFQPAVLQFEWVHATHNFTGRMRGIEDRTMRILRMLARRGYSIDRMGVDMVAMAPAGA